MQIDPWRQQLQQMYAGGMFGGRQGHQALAGPSAMQAYAMSGQGQYLNPQEQPAGGAGGMNGGGVLGGNYGGGIAGMIQQYIEQMRQQQSGSGGQMQIPRTPGLLGSY